MELGQLEKYRISIHDMGNQLRDEVYRRSWEAFAAGDRARDEIRDVRQLEERRQSMRAKLTAALGGLPESDSPLNPRVTGTIHAHGFKVEKVMFESRPDTYVTGALYLPDGVGEPQGAVLFVCGHTDEGKGDRQYQMVCQYLAHAGLIVLAIDPIGQGERLEYADGADGVEDADRPAGQGGIKPGVGEHEQMGLQCWALGQGLARYFAHDMIRAIDYLCQRPEVDPGKIGITGNSGGGTQTSLAMILEPRLAAAAPGTFITSREAYLIAGQPQDAEQIWLGMTAARFDHEDILLAMAPRPVMVLAATEDFFPIEGTRRTVERARRCWDLCGNHGGLELAEDVSPHRYSEGLAQQAAAFFARHLLGKSIPANRQAPIALFEPEQLWCTSSGTVRGDNPSARNVHDEHCRHVAALEQSRRATPSPQFRRQALDWLRSQVQAAREIGDLNPRYLLQRALGDGMSAQSVIWRSHGWMYGHAFVFRTERFAARKLPVTIALWPGGTSRMQPHEQWIRETCASGRAVMVLDVTGVGALLPHAINARPIDASLGTLHKLTMDLLWLSDSLAAMRIHDVLRALDMAEQLRGSVPDDIRIYAHGTYSLYAEIAAFLDERDVRLQVVEGFGRVGDWVCSRHYDNRDLAGLILPGMLNVFDLDELHTQ
jgi:dienelactone hydrolase